MELENALYAWASQQPGIQANIGMAPNVRLFKLKIPQGGRLPCGVQQRTGTDRQTRPCTVDGAVAVTLQLDWYARDWAGMAAAAKAFRRALDPNVAQFPVYMGGDDSPADGVKVKLAELDNEFDSDDIEPGNYRRTQLWTFWIFENAEA